MVALNLEAHTVAGTVDEVLAVARVLNDRTCPPVNVLARTPGATAARAASYASKTKLYTPATSPSSRGKNMRVVSDQYAPIIAPMSTSSGEWRSIG
jgi:hypothetical protein